MDLYVAAAIASSTIVALVVGLLIGHAAGYTKGCETGRWDGRHEARREAAVEIAQKLRTNDEEWYKRLAPERTTLTNQAHEIGALRTKVAALSTALEKCREGAAREIGRLQDKARADLRVLDARYREEREAREFAVVDKSITFMLERLAVCLNATKDEMGETRERFLPDDDEAEEGEGEDETDEDEEPAPAG